MREKKSPKQSSFDSSVDLEKEYKDKMNDGEVFSLNKRDPFKKMKTYESEDFGDK